jgi:signal transduction histidine kinase
VALALITVIPLLTLCYLVFVDPQQSENLFLKRPLLTVAMVVSVALGYVLLGRYPVSVSRLRIYLEDMVNGRLPEKIKLVTGMDDVTAIERSMNLIVEQMSRQVSKMEKELNRIEWLVSRDVSPAMRTGFGGYGAAEEAAGSGKPGGLIHDALGVEMLADIVGDFLDLVETSAVVYELDGTPALEILASDWCRLLDHACKRRQAGRDAAGAGPGGPSRCCDGGWLRAAKVAMVTGQPVDIECEGGIRVYAAPVVSRESIVGALTFGYGDPPRDAQRLQVIAERYGVAVEELQDKARRYETRPAFITGLAKNRLLTAARLVGEIVGRKRDEEVLRKSEEELRKHRAHLEELVAERTRELETANGELRKEVAERRRAEQLKDDFVSTVSHELRTPLAITKEGISLLMDGIPGSVTDSQKKVLTISQSNIDRLARIINDLLDMSKIEAGRMEIRKEDLDLVELIRDAVASLEPLAKEKGLRLDMQVEPGRIPMQADEGRLMQVLTNLAGNAIKFTDRGWVRISATAKGTEVECSVEDTGVGIAESDLPRLFDKFVQFGRKHGAGMKGTGLGLAIVRNIIELHGGRIGVESRPQKGSKFTFVLPAFSLGSGLEAKLKDRMIAAGMTETDLMLFLVRMDVDPAVDALRWETAFRTFCRTVEARLSLRKTDFMAARGSHDLVIVAEVAAEHARRLWQRWRREIVQCFGEVDGDIVLRPRMGHASYPADGKDVSTMLGVAESRLREGPTEE